MSTTSGSGPELCDRAECLLGELVAFSETPLAERPLGRTCRSVSWQISISGASAPSVQRGDLSAFSPRRSSATRGRRYPKCKTSCPHRRVWAAVDGSAAGSGAGGDGAV